MKSTTGILTIVTTMVTMAYAGSTTPAEPGNSVCAPADAFANARRPISNPTLFDLAIPRSNVHAIMMHQQLPDRAAIAGGSSVPLGGDFQVYALQVEYALNERISLVATKDGYVDFNPDATLSEESGFANIAAGLKYAFVYQPENGYALSGTTTVEVPTGSDDVTQGSGSGAVNLILSALKINGPLQWAGGAGVHLPFDSDEESTTSFVSTHISYQVCSWFTPLIELNWYSVLDEGDGSDRYDTQLGGAVPGAIAFEGGDLLNWGAAHGQDNANIVTLAAGFRSRVGEDIDLGFAYEIPLTEEDENFMESRITLDLVWNF